jgi:hypothetical protein
MTTHLHDYPAPAPTIESIEVLRVEFRRGQGCCEESPVRIVTAYYEADGRLLYEFDRAAPSSEKEGPA